MTKRFFFIFVSLVVQMLISATTIAGEDLSDQVYFSVDLTNSLGTRGILLVFLCQTPNLTMKPPGRHFLTECFEISQVGSVPINAPAGVSTGDTYSFRSSRFEYPLVRVYRTEKEEPVTIFRNEEGSEYVALAPYPLVAVCDRTLINFNALGRPGARRPMTAEISGSMANRDMLITLHGNNETYYFVFGFEGGISRWVRLAKPHAKTLPATTESSHADVKGPELTIGDQMRATLVDQQKVDINAHLVTVFIEAPRPPAKGRRKAFYYFIQEGGYGHNLMFVTAKTSEDDNAVGSGPGDDTAAHPTGNYPRSLNTGNATFDLTVGSEVSHFKYDYAHEFTSGRWVKTEGSRGR